MVPKKVSPHLARDRAALPRPPPAAQPSRLTCADRPSVSRLPPPPPPSTLAPLSQREWNFNPEWKDEVGGNHPHPARKWLIYDVRTGGMNCSLCQSMAHMDDLPGDPKPDASEPVYSPCPLAADGLEADKAKKAKKANHPADEGTGEPPKKKRKKRREK